MSLEIREGQIVYLIVCIFKCVHMLFVGECKWVFKSMCSVFVCVCMVGKVVRGGVKICVRVFMLLCNYKFLNIFIFLKRCVCVFLCQG